MVEGGYTSMSTTLSTVDEVDLEYIETARLLLSSLEDPERKVYWCTKCYSAIAAWKCTHPRTYRGWLHGAEIQGLLRKRLGI